VRVVVMSDDAHAGDEFKHAWAATVGLSTDGVEFVARFAKARPDPHFLAQLTVRENLDRFVHRVKRLAAPSAGVVQANRDAFFESLVDLLIMAAADAFVGTETSNFGQIACYLRGGVACYNAEAGRRNAYKWSDATKLS